MTDRLPMPSAMTAETAERLSDRPAPGSLPWRRPNRLPREPGRYHWTGDRWQRVFTADELAQHGK